MTNYCYVIKIYCIFFTWLNFYCHSLSFASVSTGFAIHSIQKWKIIKTLGLSADLDELDSLHNSINML